MCPSLEQKTSTIIILYTTYIYARATYYFFQNSLLLVVLPSSLRIKSASTDFFPSAYFRMRPTSIFLALFLTIWAPRSESRIPLPDYPSDDPPYNAGNNPPDNTRRPRNRAEDIFLTRETMSLPDGPPDVDHLGFNYYTEEHQSPLNQLKYAAQLSDICSPHTTIFGFTSRNGMIVKIHTEDLVQKYGRKYTEDEDEDEDEYYTISDISDELLELEVTLFFSTNGEGPISDDVEEYAQVVTLRKALDFFLDDCQGWPCLFSGVIGQADESDPGYVRDQRVFDALRILLMEKWLDHNPILLRFPYTGQDPEHFFAVEFVGDTVRAWIDDYQFVDRYPSLSVPSTRERPRFEINIPDEIKAIFVEEEEKY